MQHGQREVEAAVLAPLVVKRHLQVVQVELGELVQHYLFQVHL
jgi:hypothetical protein